ncbi:MAG: I78 family peptidase inhibitor [Rhizobiaceae bacterium]
MKLMSAAALALTASAVAACQTDAGSASTPGICRPQAAERLVGMNRLTDQQAMQLTGATLVRQIAPGQGVTLDYRQERVTIETDPRTGKITRASCG